MTGRLIARVICWWRGHRWVRCARPGRLALCCTRCLAETAGWPMPAPRPVLGKE